MGRDVRDHLSMYGDHGFPANIAEPKCVLAKKIVPNVELQVALTENSDARDEQSKLLDDLTKRLHRVLRDPLPKVDSMGPACGYPPSSPLVNDVRRATSQIRGNNLELDELIQRLTV